MTASQRSTINLGLPAVPETTDKILFYELVRVYNAINLLAQGLDSYTGDGTLLQAVTTDTESSVTVADFAKVAVQLREVTNVIDSIVDNTAEFSEFKKNGLFGTLTSGGAFGCNGKIAQPSVVLPANATDLATVITLTNAIKVALIANGIGA